MAILAAAMAATSSGVAGKISEGVAGLFGKTATDREREERASRLTSAALNGDIGALRQLCYDAFERKTGLPGDDRPADGKESPEAVKKLARAGIANYVGAKGGLPESLAGYASRVGAAVVVEQKPPSAFQSVGTAVLDTIKQGVTGGVADGTRQAVTQAGAAAIPWIGITAIVVGGVLAIYLLRK